jgi:predicted enzyme related to lactoylglutathione lyase
MNLTFLHFQVKDLKLMSAWYRDVVGLKQNVDGEDFKGFVTDSGFYLNMSKERVSVSERISNTFSLGFGVPHFSDVDDAYSRVLKSGGKSIAEPQTKEWGHREAYVADPEGNTLAIIAVEE